MHIKIIYLYILGKIYHLISVDVRTLSQQTNTNKLINW